MREPPVAVAAVRTVDADATRAVGAAVGSLLRPGDVVVLDGELGAGKTVFTAGIGDALAVDDTVVSPTFTIVHELHGRHRVAHADLYRVPDPHDLEATGIGEYLDAPPDDAEAWIVVVEWGAAAVDRLGPDRLDVRLDYGAPDEHESVRRLTFTAHGARWSDRVAALRDALAPFAPSGDGSGAR